MVQALQRMVRGFVGAWCIFGPMMLIFAHDRLPAGALAMVFVLVLIFYVSGVWKWRRKGFGFVKAVAKDMVLSFLLVLLGSAISGWLQPLVDRPCT